MPMNLQERVKHLENETGIKMNPKQFLSMNNFAGKLIKGQDHVACGHQHFCGWDVPVNFQQAVKYYTKAASVKNPEGMYNLANCYFHGYGVNQDVHEALRIYKETAEMDNRTLGQFTPLQFNAGVAGSQHSIGLMYDEGIAVEQNFTEAASWYKRAMDNGVGNAANNLGILYAKGWGVPRDETMAELCWKQAINLKDFNAPASLFGYYSSQMEPEKAAEIAEIGRKMGNPGLLSLPDEELHRAIANAKSMRNLMEPNVLKFEKDHKLDVKGFTFKQRLTRQLRYIDPIITKCLNICENNSESANWGGKAQPPTPDKIILIEKKAIHGSETASRIMETWNYCFQLFELIKSEKLNDKSIEIINLYYKSITLEHHLIFLPQHFHRNLKAVLAALFEESCDVKGETDMKIRLCFVMLNLSGSLSSDDCYGLELLKEGSRRYPDNEHYYQFLTDSLGNKKKYKDGRLYAEKGLKISPKNADLLYSRAVHMRLEETQPPDQCIEAYKKFIAIAPFDHRKIPESFYQIACLYWECNEERGSELMEKVQLYYKLGQKAEEGQLPIYLPYESPAKSLLQGYLHLVGNGKDSVTQTSIDSKAEFGRVGILERKSYLKSPTRKALLLSHRELIHSTEETRRKNKHLGTKGTTVTPKFTQGPAKKMSVVKPITLLEMNPTEDHIFENRILDLTIIEDANLNFPSLHLIAEDDNGDVTRLYIYNVDKNPETIDKFRTGCRIAIINPYMRIGAQSISSGIRNDEPRCIVYLQKIESMCRFCGEENASRRCSKCKRPYCSEECQTLDWKEFNHKLICPYVL